MTPKDSNCTSKLGRKGDPRMHRAVAARLSNPEMPLVDALKEGGFHFPNSDTNDTTIADSDGVTLGQRKNQLSRRLRLAKQSMSSQKGLQGQPENNELTPKETGITARKRGAKRCTPIVPENVEDVDAKSDTVNLERATQYHPRFYSGGNRNTDHVNFSAPAVSSTPINLCPNPAHSQLGNSGAGPLNVTHTSGVAMASLISTAASVGMTLEQLALRLANTPTLFQSLSSNPDPAARLQLALSLYQVDSRALFQKCMLIAGYDGADSIEGSRNYMQLALKMWETEGKRLGALLGHPNSEQIGDFCRRFIETARQRNTLVLPEGQGRTDVVNPARGTVSEGSENNEPSYNENINSENSKLYSVARGSNQQEEIESHIHSIEGRHVHRLSGKCGHKAIIHQPPGRPAHIDFVVDGKIECYEGIKPVGPRGQGALWPSRHKCIDLACPTDGRGHALACGSNMTELDVHHSEVQCVEPKQLSLTDVDFDGKEWNVDFFSHDGQDDTLLGLIKLGDGDKKEEI
eukprot:CAMPEP_0194136356 /NCGR_PEP_ID=MMETSP0152-20130528/6382_1 /TAXON_ID=1049557 /ORGANISM="Thalassiothrix antarctica, Strain L6-D1" /LENGTH=517 /DNA_ID=CAMNT_0038832973 /DNA_START=76 /DNA_END=1629 /DNA_ORIENTATION=+